MVYKIIESDGREWGHSAPWVFSSTLKELVNESHYSALSLEFSNIFSFQLFIKLPFWKLLLNLLPSVFDAVQPTSGLFTVHTASCLINVHASSGLFTDHRTSVSFGSLNSLAWKKYSPSSFKIKNRKSLPNLHFIVSALHQIIHYSWSSLIT